MFEKFVGKFCGWIDASPAFQRFLTITPRQEKIARLTFLPALAVAAWFIFWSVQATAAEPNLERFFLIHEAKPILIQTQDANGQPINEVRQISLLVQLPGERVARRILVSLDDNLLLDPRAPAPGEKTYHGIIELDGSFTASPVARP